MWPVATAPGLEAGQSPPRVWSRNDQSSVNGMSLSSGRTISNKTGNPTTTHHNRSIGTAVDVSGNGGHGSIPAELLEDFVEACKDAGASRAAVEGSGVQRHVHCNW